MRPRLKSLRSETRKACPATRKNDILRDSARAVTTLSPVQLSSSLKLLGRSAAMTRRDASNQGHTGAPAIWNN